MLEELGIILALFLYLVDELLEPGVFLSESASLVLQDWVLSDQGLQVLLLPVSSRVLRRPAAGVLLGRRRVLGEQQVCRRVPISWNRL